MPTAAARRAAEADKARQKAKTVTKKKPSAATKKPKSSIRVKAKTDEKIGLDELIASRLNEREKFSVVIGEYRHGNTVSIAEKMRFYEVETGKYRLKLVQYHFFPTRDALEAFCDRHKIPIEFPSR